MIIFIFTFCNISRTRLVKTTSKEFAASSIESLTPTYTSSFHNIESSTFPQSHDPYRPSDANRPPSPGDQFRHGRSVSIASIKSSVTVHFNENKLDEKSRSVSFPVIKQPQEIRIKEDESSRLTKEPEKAKEYTEYYEDPNTKVKIDREKSNVEITKRETVEKDEQVYKIKQIVVVSVDDKKQKENDRTSDTEMNDSHEISDKEYSESCDATESVNQKSDEEGSERTLSPISDTELTDTVEIEEKHGTIIKGVEKQQENDVKSKEEKSVTIGDVQIMNAKRHGYLKPLTKTPSSEIDKSKRRRKRLERGKLEETNEERLSKEIVRANDDKEKEISITEQALEDLGKGAQDDGDKEIECVIGDTAVPRTVIKDAKKSVDHSQKTVDNSQKEVSKSKPTSNIDELVLHQKIDKGEVTTDEDETKDDYEDDFEEEDINISLREESPRKENEPVETTAQVDVAASEESYKKTTEKQKIDEINVVQEVKENLSFSQHGQRDDETEDTKLQVSSNKLNIIDRPEEKLSSVISQKIEEDKRLSEAKLEKTVLEIKLGKQKEGTEVREGKEREMESLLGIPVHVPSSEKSEESGNTKVEMSDTCQTRKEIVSEKQETVKERNLHRLHISNSSINTLIITRDTLYPEQKESQEHINSLIGTETVSKSKKDIQLESTEITNNVSLESSNSKATKKMISCGNKSFATQTISSQATQTINSVQIQTVSEMQTQTIESTSTQTTTAAESQTEKQGRINISSVDSNQVAEYAKGNARQVDMIDVTTSPVPETLFVLKRHQSENILTDSIVTRSSIEEKRHIKELDILLDKTIESVTKEPEHKNEEPDSLRNKTQEGVTTQPEQKDEEPEHIDIGPDTQLDKTRESVTKEPRFKDDVSDNQNDKSYEIVTAEPEHKDEKPESHHEKTLECVTKEPEHKDSVSNNQNDRTLLIVTRLPEQKPDEGPDNQHDKTRKSVTTEPEPKDEESASERYKTGKSVTKKPEHKDSVPYFQHDQTQEIVTTKPEHKDSMPYYSNDRKQELVSIEPNRKDEKPDKQRDKTQGVKTESEHKYSLPDSRSDETQKIVTTDPEKRDKEPNSLHEQTQEGVTKEAEHEDEESASESDEKRESETKGPEHKDGIPDEQNDQTQEILTRAPEHKDDMPDDQKDKTHEIVTIELEHKDGLPDSLSDKAHKIVTTEHAQKGEEPDSLPEKTQEGLTKEPEHKDKEADSQHDKTRERVTKEPEHKDSIPDNQNDQAEEFVTTWPDYRNDKTQEIFTTEPEHKDKHGDSLHDKTQEGLTKKPEHKDEESACEHDKNRESVTKVPEHEESMLDSQSDKTHKIVTTAPEQKGDEPYGQHDKTQQGVTTKPEYKGEEADSQRDYQHKDEESACERDKDILPDNKNDQTQEIVTTESEHKDSVPDYQKDKTHKIVAKEPENKDVEPDKQRDKTHEGATTEPEHKKSLTDSLSDKTQKIVCLHTKGEELNSSVHEKYQEVVTTEPEHKNEEADNQGDNAQESLTKEPEHKDIVPDNQNYQTQEIVTTKPEQIDSVTDYQNDKAQEIVTKEPEQNDEHGYIVRDKTGECVTSQSEHKDGVPDYQNDTTQERVTTEPEHKGEEPDSLRDKTQGVTTEPKHKDEESSSEHDKKRECVTKDPEHKAIASNSRSDKTHAIVTTDPEQKDEEPDSLNDKTQEHITDVTTEPEHKGEGSTSKHDKTYESVTKEPEHKDSVPDNQNAQTLEIVTTEPKNKDIVPDYQKDQTQEIVTIELDHKNSVLDNQNNNTHEIVTKEPKNKDEKPDKQRNKTQIAVTTDPEHKNSTPDHQNDKTQEIITTEPKHKDEEPDKQREKTQDGVTTEPEHKGSLSDSWSDKAREIVTTEFEQKNEMPEIIHEKHKKGVTVEHKNKGEKPDSQRDKKRDSVTKEAEYKDCVPDNQSDQTQEFVTTEPNHKDSGPDYQTNQKQEIGTTEPRYKYEHANSLRNKTQESVTTDLEHKDEEPDSLRDKTQEGVTTETEYKDEEPDSLRDKTQESVTTELEHKDEEPDKLCDITQGVTSEPEHADEHVDGLRDKTQEGVTSKSELKDEEPDSLHNKTQEGVTSEPEHKDEEPDSLRDKTQEGVTTEPEHKDEEPDSLRDFTQEGITKELEHKDEEPDKLRDITQEGVTTEPEHKDEEPDNFREKTQEGFTTEPEHKDEEPDKLRYRTQEGVTTEPEHKDEEPDNLREKKQECIKTEPEHKDEEPDYLREKTQEGIQTEPEHIDEEPDKLRDIAQEGVTTEPEHKDEEPDKLRDITQEGVTTEPEHKDEESDKLREITQEGVTTEPEHKDEKPDKLREIIQEGIKTEPEHKDEEPDNLREMIQEGVTTEPEHKDEEPDKQSEITQEGVTTEPEHKDEKPDKLREITQEGVTTEPEHKDEEPDNLREITQEGVTTEPEHKDEKPDKLCDKTQEGFTIEPEHKDEKPDKQRDITHKGVTTTPEHKDEEPDKLRDITQEGITTEPEHKDEESDKLREITQEGVTTEPEHKDEEPDKLQDITQEGVTTEPEHKNEEPDDLREKTQERVTTEPEHKDEKPDKLRNKTQEGFTTEPKHKDEKPDKQSDITHKGVTTTPEHKDEEPDKLRDITQEGVSTEPEQKDEESASEHDKKQENVTKEPEQKDSVLENKIDQAQQIVTTEPEQTDTVHDYENDQIQETITTKPEHKDSVPDYQKDKTHEIVTIEPEHKDEECEEQYDKAQDRATIEPEHKKNLYDSQSDKTHKIVIIESEQKVEGPDSPRDKSQEDVTIEPEHKIEEPDSQHDITRGSVTKKLEDKGSVPDNQNDRKHEIVTTELEHNDENDDNIGDKTQEGVKTEPEHKGEETRTLHDRTQEGVTIEPEHKDEEPDSLRDKTQEGFTIEPEYKDEKPNSLRDKTQKGVTTEPEYKDEESASDHDKQRESVSKEPANQDSVPDNQSDKIQEIVKTEPKHKGIVPDNQNEKTQKIITTQAEHKDSLPDYQNDKTQESVTTKPKHKDNLADSRSDKTHKIVTAQPEQKGNVPDYQNDKTQECVSTELEHKIEEPHSQRGKTPGSETKETENQDIVPDYHKDQSQEIVTTEPEQKNSVPDHQKEKTQEIIRREPEHKDEEHDKQRDKTEEDATTETEHKDSLSDSWSDKAREIVTTQPEQKDIAPDNQNDKTQKCVTKEPKHEDNVPDNQNDQTPRTVKTEPEQRERELENLSNKTHESPTIQTEHNVNQNDKTYETETAKPDHLDKKPDIQNEKAQTIVATEHDNKDRELDHLIDKKDTTIKIDPENKEKELDDQSTKTQETLTTEPEHKDSEPDNQIDTLPESVTKDSEDKVKEPNDQCDKTQEGITKGPGRKDSAPENQRDKTDEVVSTEPEHVFEEPDSQHDRTREDVKQYTSQERGTKEPYNSEKTAESNQSGYPETIVETESYKHSTQLQINMSADSSLEFIEKLTELEVLDNQKVNDTNELDKNDGENIQYYSPACEPIESIPAMIPAYLGVDSNESCVEMVALESESKCDILYLSKGVLKTDLESMDKAIDAYSELNDVNLLHISASISENTDGKTNQTVLFDHSQRETSDKDFIEQGLSEKDAKETIPGVDNYPEISEMKHQKVTVDVTEVDEQEDKQEKAKSERDTGNQTIMKTDKDSKETKDGLNHSDIEISSTLEDIKDLQELKSSSTELSDNSYSYETTFDETSPEKSQAETTDKLSSLVSDSDRKDLNESKSEHYNSTDEIFDIITDKQSIVEATEEAESSIYENVIEKEQLNDYSVQSSPKQVTEGEQCEIKSTHKRSQAIMNDAQGQSVKTSPEIIKEPIDTEEDIQTGDCNNEAPIKEKVFEEDNVGEKSSKGKNQESLTSEFYTNTSNSNAATEYMFPEQGHVLQGDKQDDIIERENIIINETESNIPVSSSKGKSVCLSTKDMYQKLETTQESSECYIKETVVKLIPQQAVDSFEGKNHSNDDTVEKSLRRLENEYVSFELDTKPTDDISLTSGNASQTPEMRNYKISKENDREEQDLKQEINALTIEDVTEGRRSMQVEYLSESKGEGQTDTMINKVSDMKPDTYSKEKRLEKDNSGNYINLIDETTKLESDQSESYYIKQTSGDESLLSGLSLENDNQMTKQTDTYSKPPMQVEGNDKDHLRPVNKNEQTPSDDKVHMKEKIATTDEARLINVLKHNLGDSKEILPENKCDKYSKEILEGNLETCSQDDTFTTVSTLTSTFKFTDTVLDNFEQENGFKRNEHREDKHAYHSASGFEDLAPSTYDQSSSPKEYYKLESTIPEETGHQIHDKQTLNQERTECMADLSNLGISDIFESVTNRDNESVDIYNQDTSQGISDISEASLEGPGEKTDHDEAQKQELQLDGSHTNDALDPLAPNESQSEISPQLESSNELKDAQLLLHQSSTKPEFTCTTYIAESSSAAQGKSDAIEVSDKQAQVECISMTYSVVEHDGQKSESTDSRITDNSLLNVNVIQDELPKQEGMSKNTTIPISSNKVNETSLILDKSTTKQESTFTTHTNESTSKIHIDVSGTKDISESSNQVESTPQALDESALKPEQSNSKTVIRESTSSNDIDDSTPDFKDVIDEGIATEAIPEIETTPKVRSEFKDEDLVVDQGATMPERFDLKDIDKSTSAKHFDGSHGNNIQKKQAQTQLTLEGEDSPKSSNQLRDDELVINQSSRNLESSCTIVIDEAGLHLKEQPNEQSQTEASSSSQNKFTLESSNELKKAESNIDQNIWDQKTTGTTFIADSTDYKENDKFRLEVNGVSGEQANREGTPDLKPTLVSYDGQIVSDQSALIPEYDGTKDIDKSTSEILTDVSDANKERDKPAQIQVTSEKKSIPSNEIEDTELVSDPYMKELASSSMIVMDKSTSLTHLENSSLKLITDTQVLYESLSEMESTAKSPKELKDTKLKKHQGTITHESSGNTFIDEHTSTKYMNISKSEFNDVLNEQAQTEALSEIEPISQLCSELKEGESVLEQSATMPESNDLKNVLASTAIVNLDVSNVRDVQETLAQSLKSESDPSLESSVEIKDPRLVIDCSTKKPESFSIAATDEATSSLQLEGSAFKEIPDLHGRNEVQAEIDAKAKISKEVKESELNINRMILEKESIVTITIGELRGSKDMDKSASDAGDVSDKQSQKEASSDSCSELKVANSIKDKSGMMAEYDKAKSIEASSEIESLPVSSNELTDANLLLTQSSMNSESTHSTVMDESHGSKDNVESTSISKDVLNEEAEKEATSQIKPKLESCNELDVIDQNTMKRTSSESTAIGESIGVKDINETTTDLKHVQDEQALIKVTTDLEPNFESYNEFKDENLVIDPSATRTESTDMKDMHDSVTKIQYDSLDFKLVPDQKISRESESNMELRLETSSELKDTTAVIASKTNNGSLSDNKDESQRAVIKETFEIEHSPESPYELKEGETKAEQCRTKAEFIDTTETGESTSMKQFDESEVNCALDKQDRKVASSDINITPGSPTELKDTKSVIDQSKLKPELTNSGKIGETTCPTETEESTTNFKEISDNQSKTDLTDPESSSKLCEELKDRHVVLNQTVTNQEYIYVKGINASSSNTQLECPHENDVQEKNTLTEETSEMDPNKLKDDDSVTNQSNLKVGSTYSAVISESTSSTDLDESSKKLDLKVVIENQPQRKVKTGNLSTSESYDAFKDAKSDIDHRSATYPKSAYPKEIHESPCKVQSESDLNNVTDKQAPTEANSETDPTIESKEKLGVDNSGINFGTSTDSNQITGPTTGSCNELKDEEAVSDENTTNSESVSMKHVDESASNKQSESLGPNVNSVLEKLTLSEIKSHIELKPKSDCTISDNIEPKSTFQDGPDEQVQTEIKREIEPTLELYDNLQDVKSVEDKSTTIPESANSKDESTSYKKLIMQDVTDVPDKQALTELTSEMELKTNSADNLKYDNPVTNQRESKPESVSITIGEFTGMKDIDELSSDLKDVSSGKANTEAETETEPVSESCNMLKDEKILANQTVMNPESTYLKENCGSTPNLQLEMPDVNNVQDKQASKEATSEMDPTPEPAEKLKRDDSLNRQSDLKLESTDSIVVSESTAFKEIGDSSRYLKDASDMQAQTDIKTAIETKPESCGDLKDEESIVYQSATNQESTFLKDVDKSTSHIKKLEGSVVKDIPTKAISEMKPMSESANESDQSATKPEYTGFAVIEETISKKNEVTDMQAPTDAASEKEPKPVLSVEMNDSKSFEDESQRLIDISEPTPDTKDLPGKQAQLGGASGIAPGVDSSIELKFTGSVITQKATETDSTGNSDTGDSTFKIQWDGSGIKDLSNNEDLTDPTFGIKPELKTSNIWEESKSATDRSFTEPESTGTTDTGKSTSSVQLDGSNVKDKYDKQPPTLIISEAKSIKVAPDLVKDGETVMKQRTEKHESIESKDKNESLPKRQVGESESKDTLVDPALVHVTSETDSTPRSSSEDTSYTDTFETLSDGQTTQESRFQTSQTSGKVTSQISGDIKESATTELRRSSLSDLEELPLE